jgi:hypothetical protein
MKFPCKTFLAALLGATAFGSTALLAQSDNPFETKPVKDSQDQIRTGVQITELGLMKALLVLDQSSLDSEKLLAQRLNEADFRVFPSAQTVSSRLSFEQIQAIGKEGKADLLVYAVATTRPKKAMGEFQLHEGEATVQIYSPATGELMVTHTARTDGTRTTDEVAAQRSAREKALDLATKEAIVKSLEKAHKIMVYQAILTGVQSNTDLLFFMEYIAKLQGVYDVRQISWNAKTGDAEIEIIASPKAETFWRAQIEAMPKRKVTVVKYVNRPPKPAATGTDAVPAWLKRK